MRRLRHLQWRLLLLLLLLLLLSALVHVHVKGGRICGSNLLRLLLLLLPKAMMIRSPLIFCFFFFPCRLLAQIVQHSLL